MERGAVTFDDVAVYFTEEEWQRLQEEEKNLYKEVMNDNYQMILSLNRPDLITNIELGCDLYIPTARAGAIQDSWQEERLAASDRSIFQEDTRSEAPLKRQRRYPRVNPLRWMKTQKKKSKNHSQRTSQRSEHRDHKTSPEWPVEARNSEEGSSGVHTEGSSIPVQTSEQKVEQRHLQTGRRPGEGDPRSWTTSTREVRYRPDLRVTLNISKGEDSQGTPGNGEGPSDQGHNRLHRERATSMADAAPPTVKDPTDISSENGATPCCRDAAKPTPTTPTKTTDLTLTEGSVHPDCMCDEMKATSPWRREKRVKFSDTVTTFIFGAEATENTERALELRSKYRPCPSHVTSTREPRNRGKEYIVLKSQDSKPNATPPKRRTTRVRDTLETGDRDLKTQNSMRFIKKTEEAEISPPCMESGSDPTESPPSTGAQKKDVGTQINLMHKEEEHDRESKIQLTPPTNTEQNFIKSYACTNCGTTTHWTKLNKQQKADTKRSTLHICKMCRRQNKKNKAILSPHNDSSTQNTGRANMARSLARTKPRYSLLDDSSIDGPTTKKKHKTNGEAETSRSPANHNIHLKKVEESLGTFINHNVQLNKVEESQSTSTSHNGQLKEGEELPRTSTNHNIQLKKKDESPRTLANHNVHVMNVEEETVVNSTNHTVQVKKANHRKKCLAAQDTRTENKSSLCSQCGDCGAPEDTQLHHKVKSINGTPKRAANVPSSSDLKIYTPGRRKSNKVLKNGTSSVQEEKLSSSSRASRSTISHNHQKNRVQANKGGKHDMCEKRLLKGQNIKALTTIQHKRPVRGGPSIITESVQKQSIKSDAVRKERVKKKSPDEPKEKKSQNTEDPKSPRPARGSRDRVLCTKCGKRMALHVTPSQGGPNEGGSNENECVVLPRKKRKRPLAGMEPFTCKECGKIFTRHFTLLQHRLIHTGERPYACKVCGKTFRDSSYLIVHMRSHTKEKPYSCTECGKCFSQNSALHVHLRTHSDERPFRCQDCGKSFTDRSTYRHHLRIHTGEKPYACSFCGKKFTQQPHMKRHETIHTGERPFGCTQCGKRFIERTKLKKHELVHQKGKD